MLPKSPMGGAIGYMRNNWEALKRYTELGLPVDRQQRLRATHEDDRNWTEELVVHGE